jgi:uncharacterized protein YjbI with pentapeptide repeats
MSAFVRLIRGTQGPRRLRIVAFLALPFFMIAACSTSGEQTPGIGANGSGANGSGADGSGADGSGANGSGANGSAGTLVLPSGGSSAGTTAPSDAGFDACSGSAHEQETLPGPLDIYLVFDRTASMGTDCSYAPGGAPTENSKACFATYALADYLINVTPLVDTRLAFQFMSLADDDCDGVPYATPLVPLTQLPVAQDHTFIQAISDETFQGGFGTHIEGALRGIAQFTPLNQTADREMIGVLMTDGDPNGCEGDIDTLATLIENHLLATNIRTFIIGMEGATDENLEILAVAGGAEPHADWCGSLAPPCHYWNVGDGSGDAISSALQAIIGQAAPLPCAYNVADFSLPDGATLDFGKVNVTLTDANGVDTTIGQVPDAAACPLDQPAWYYDSPSAPTTINLCPTTCDLVTGAADGSRMTVVLGCDDTVILPPPK